MANHTRVIPVFRGILQELKLSGLLGSTAHKHLLEKYKSNKVTAGRHCRENDAAQYDASALYCLMRSTREYQQLVEKYHGHNDDSTISKAAHRVGLELPKLYENNKNGPGQIPE